MPAHRTSSSRSELPAWMAPWSTWVGLQVAPVQGTAAPHPAEGCATARDARRALRLMRGLARAFLPAPSVRAPRTARTA